MKSPPPLRAPLARKESLAALHGPDSNETKRRTTQARSKWFGSLTPRNVDDGWWPVTQPGSPQPCDNAELERNWPASARVHSGGFGAARPECETLGEWGGEWLRRMEHFWLITPFREGLRTCFTALGLHLSSRFRIALSLLRAAPGERQQLRAAPPSPAVNDDGCDWVAEKMDSGELNLPDFPDLPPESDFPSEWRTPSVVPLPRLVPNWNHLQSVYDRSELQRQQRQRKVHGGVGGSVDGDAMSGRTEERPLRGGQVSSELSTWEGYLDLPELPMPSYGRQSQNVDNPMAPPSLASTGYFWLGLGMSLPTLVFLQRCVRGFHGGIRGDRCRC